MSERSAQEQLSWRGLEGVGRHKSANFSNRNCKHRALSQHRFISCKNINKNKILIGTTILPKCTIFICITHQTVNFMFIKNVTYILETTYKRLCSYQKLLQKVLFSNKQLKGNVCYYYQ